MFSAEHARKKVLEVREELRECHENGNWMVC